MNKFKLKTLTFLGLVGILPRIGEYLYVFENNGLKVSLYMDPTHAYLCQYDHATNTWSRQARFTNRSAAIAAMQRTNETLKLHATVDFNYFKTTVVSYYNVTLGLENV